MKPSKIQTLGFLYILFLVLAAFYVNNTLKEGNIEVRQAEEEERNIEVKPVKVNLVVDDGSTQRTYQKNLRNRDSVLTLLERVRDEDKVLYEIVAYIDRTEIVDVYRVPVPEGYNWKIYLDNADLTNVLEETFLSDDSTYILKLVKK